MDWRTKFQFWIIAFVYGTIFSSLPFIIYLTSGSESLDIKSLIFYILFQGIIISAYSMRKIIKIKKHSEYQDVMNVRKIDTDSYLEFVNHVNIDIRCNEYEKKLCTLVSKAIYEKYYVVPR